MKKITLSLSGMGLALALSGCGGAADAPVAPAVTAPADAVVSEPAAEAAPVDAFMAAIAQHCGKAFAGKIITNQPASTTPDAFEGKALIMHVRGCDEPTKELRVPFHVGEDHSRTWIITRTGTGARLKHDHRHEDGSEDVQTMYGGDTASAGTAIRQEFPVDAYSVELFKKQGIEASTTNTWAMEIDPGKRFLYELSRPSGRMFQVEFDLTTPVALPPAPWGSEG